ncbi:MAG: MFS transporter [Parvularcula sp.]
MTSMVLTRRFWPLFGAQTLGAFADNTLRMATIVACAAAFRMETDDFALPHGLGEHSGTIVSMAFTLPVMLFSVLAGQFADKYSRSGLIRRLKLIEVALMTLAALFFALGNGVALIATLFLMGTQSAFFSPVRNAVMPQYYGAHELVRANGYYNAALFVAVVTGLGLGGHFVNQDGGRLIVSAMLVGAAALGACLAMFTPQADAPGLDRIRWNIPRVAVQQFNDVRQMRGVLYPIIGIGWFWMIGAAVLANIPNYVPEVLGGNDTDMSLLQATFAIGAGVGSILAGIIGGRMKNTLILAGVGVLGTVIGSALIWYFSLHGASFTDGLVQGRNGPLIFALILTAGMNGVFAVPLMASVQRRAPDASRAQVMGVSNMTNGALATLGAYLIVPLRQSGVDPARIFLILAVLQGALFAFMVLRYRMLSQLR